MLVPGWYLPPHKKKIDFNAEAAAFLSQSFRLEDGYEMPSPPAAWLTLLELVTSQYFLDPMGCGAEDVFIALALLDAGRKGVYPADQYRRGNKAILLKMAADFGAKHGTAVIHGLGDVIQQTLVIPFQGLEMLPRRQGDPKEFLYDADFLASVCGAVAMGTGDDFDRILWDTPLLRVGYLRVFRSRYEGEKGIERPDDQGITKALLKEAEEREARGELHPWQIAEPFRFEPSEIQIAARPEIIDEHMRIKQEFIKARKGQK